MKGLQVSMMVHALAVTALLSMPMISMAEYDKEIAKKVTDGKKQVDKKADSKKAELKKTVDAAKSDPKMFWPYSKIELSSDQKQKIKDIRTETNRKMRELKEAERQQILGLLSKDQQVAVDKLEAEKHQEHIKKLKAWSEKKKAEVKESSDKPIKDMKKIYKEKEKKNYEKKADEMKEEFKDM